MKVRNLALYAILGVITFTLKSVMAPLPNIEPVTLLVMIYATAFQWKAIYPIGIYIVLEMLVYGFGLWSVGYCYIWLSLALISMIVLPKINNNWMPVMLAGLFGLLFGALYIPVYAIYGGIAYGITWWIAGIPYDIVHGVGNAVIALVLYKPLTNVFKKMYERY